MRLLRLLAAWIFIAVVAWMSILLYRDVMILSGRLILDEYHEESGRVTAYIPTTTEIALRASTTILCLALAFYLFTHPSSRKRGRDVS